MRTINREDFESILPEGWFDKAELFKNELLGKSAEERSKFFKDHPIWQELLVPLKSLSNNKCWYSEAQEVMSDMDVDHFRPKNEAVQFDEIGKKTSREGYWWLAYDWKNYRLSSIYSNRFRKDKHTEENISFGKGSYFPLRNGCVMATCLEEMDDEVFLLLDPINPDDPDLLFFTDEGYAIPAVLEEDEPWGFQRAKVSIDLYHLNHTPLKDARKVVWNYCQRKINDLKEVTRKPHRSARDEEKISSIRQDLREMISKNAEFSAVALACIEKNKVRMAA
ncbi:hypothetical protein [Flavobacterium sp. AJR]|uniref:hypothetical protein n=1 Tax=Flavobacterium sp. AJR TaxID=1979369 RepID=UPI000A3D7ABD|nr:hypothetical protein [Flavobacterium sp. AJR]OUL60048.1 hypothetical protein B8T70_22380 [Flavobacterium sp. AJR]